MTVRLIIDAGPGLNFFSVNKERLLISVLGPLCVPEAVQTEILRKAKREARFAAAASVWAKITPRYMQVLSDDATSELAAAVSRISRLPYEQRIKDKDNLGETMVLAHAAVAAEQGKPVIVLIDEGEGGRIAAAEAARLDRLRGQGRPVGSIGLVDTVTVLQRAAGGEHLPDRGALRDLYRRLRQLDDALLPLENTNLLSLPCWR